MKVLDKKKEEKSGNYIRFISYLVIFYSICILAIYFFSMYSENVYKKLFFENQLKYIGFLFLTWILVYIVPLSARFPLLYYPTLPEKVVSKKHNYLLCNHRSKMEPFSPVKT
jgi:hypothetical protein